MTGVTSHFRGLGNNEAVARSKGFSSIMAAAILSGVTIGAGIFTLQYSNATSYLTDSPEACANCHVMNEQYAGWLKGSHRKAAACNDCHAPHSLVPKYMTKALNGYLHSWAFTTGRFPDHIRITQRNLRVTEGACLHCHGEVAANAPHGGPNGNGSCLHCHSGVGHNK